MTKLIVGDLVILDRNLALNHGTGYTDPPDRYDNPGVIRAIAGSEGGVLIEFSLPIKDGHDGFDNLVPGSRQCWWVNKRHVRLFHDGEVRIANADDLF